MDGGTHEGTHHEVGSEPSDGGVHNELAGELLQLAVVQLFHFQDFKLGQVVILMRKNDNR